MKSGLLSITFRKLTPQEIIKLVTQAGLDAIEWGGDIHVPPGDLAKAREIRDMTRDAGLEISSYGSYYKVGVNDNFAQVLESALELGAPVIRVWAGDRGTDQADEAWWSKVIAESREISEHASQANIGIAFEYHANTLTDRIDQAQRLLTEVNSANVTSYWQPVAALSLEENMHVLTSLHPWLSYLHVFHWNHEPRQRLSLAEGISHWEKYIHATHRIDLPQSITQRYAMLEFVKEDSPEQFLQDAAVLKKLLA